MRVRNITDEDVTLRLPDGTEIGVAAGQLGEVPDDVECEQLRPTPSAAKRQKPTSTEPATAAPEE